MKRFPTLILAAAGLAACTPSKALMPHDWALDVQTAETMAAHSSLAEHYEDIARTMDDDAAEERKLLNAYNAAPHKYGKNILDIRARSEAMVRDFELAAEESRKMANYHRQLANAGSKP